MRGASAAVAVFTGRWEAGREEREEREVGCEGGCECVVNQSRQMLLHQVAPPLDSESIKKEEEEEEGLFRADAVNEEDPERDRATQV